MHRKKLSGLQGVTAYSAGPLKKSEITKAIERLLAQIVTDYHRSDIRLYLNPHQEYELRIDNDTINLSLLLKHADMSQLEITPPILQSIDKILNEVLTLYANAPKGDGACSLLTPIHRRVVNFYTKKAIDSQLIYSDIGKLFRGEKIKNPVSALSCFLLGCVLCDAVNQLPVLLDSQEVYEEEKYVLNKIQQAALLHFKKGKSSIITFLDEINGEEQYKHILNEAVEKNIISKTEFNLMTEKYKKLKPLLGGYSVLKRREKLTDAQFKQRKEADAVLLPSISSTTYHNEANLIFGEYETVFSAPRIPSVESLSAITEIEEREVLLPAGIHVSYRENPDHEKTLFGTIIQSPAISTGYWPEHALRHAFTHHLSKEYQDQSDHQRSGGEVVCRPHHGLVHSYRVMDYVPYVRAYFAKHAADQNFRQYCEGLDTRMMEWLQIAAAFSVTGRESEVGFQDDPVLYDKYRKKSVEYFDAYIAANNPLPDDPERESNIKRMRDVILFMGSPDYLASLDRIADPQEKLARSCLHTILNVSHKLDLPRCYDYRKFINCFGFLNNLISTNEEQKKDWNALLAYATSLIRRTGDSLSFVIDSDGNVKWVNQMYNLPVFGKLSHYPALLFSGNIPEVNPTGALQTLEDHFKVAGNVSYRDQFLRLSEEYQLVAITAPEFRHTQLFLQDILNKIWPDKLSHEIDLYFTSAGNQLVFTLVVFKRPMIVIHRDFMAGNLYDDVDSEELAFALERELLYLKKYGMDVEQSIYPNEDYLLDREIIEKRFNGAAAIRYLQRKTNFEKNNTPSINLKLKSSIKELISASTEQRIKMMMGLLAERDDLTGIKSTIRISSIVRKEAKSIRAKTFFTKNFISLLFDRTKQFAFLKACLPELWKELIPYEYTNQPSVRVREYCRLLKSLALDLSAKEDEHFAHELILEAFNQQIPAFEQLYVTVLNMPIENQHEEKKDLKPMGIFREYQAAVNCFVQAKQYHAMLIAAKKISEVKEKLRSHFSKRDATDKHLKIYTTKHPGKLPFGQDRLFLSGIGERIDWTGFIKIDEENCPWQLHADYASRDKSKTIANALWQLGVHHDPVIWSCFSPEELIEKVYNLHREYGGVALPSNLSGYAKSQECSYRGDCGRLILAHLSDNHVPVLEVLNAKGDFKSRLAAFLSANWPMLMCPGFDGKNLSNPVVDAMLSVFTAIALSGTQEEKDVVKHFFLGNSQDEQTLRYFQNFKKVPEGYLLSPKDAYIQFVLEERYQNQTFTLFSSDEKIAFVNLASFKRYEIHPEVYINIFGLPFKELSLACLEVLIPLLDKNGFNSFSIGHVIQYHLDQFAPYPLFSHDGAVVVGLTRYHYRPSDTKKVLQSFSWEFPEEGHFENVSLMDLIQIYQVYDANLLFPTMEVQAKFGQLLFAQIEKMTHLDERIQAIQCWLLNAMNKIKDSEDWKYAPPMNDYELRTILIAKLADDYLIKYGKDTGLSDYVKSLKVVIDNIIVHAPRRDRLSLLSKLADKLEMQQELCVYLSLCFNSDTSNQDNKKLAAQESASSGGWLVAASSLLSKDREMQQRFIEFLVDPLTQSNLDHFAETVVRHEQCRDLMTLRGHPDDYSAEEKENIKPLLQNMYHAFWDVSLKERAIVMESLFIPPDKVISEAARLAAYEKGFNYVASKLFPKASSDEHEGFALAFTLAYLEQAQPYYRAYLLAGMIVSANESNHQQARVGKKLALLCEHLGPAYVKLAQAIQSHENTPKDIRDDLSHVKGRANPPYRWDLWQLIDRVLSEEAKNRIKHLGPVLGSASYNIAAAATLANGSSVVLSLLRDKAEEQAREGFDHLKRTVIACQHPMMNRMREEVLAILVEAAKLSKIEMDVHASVIQYQHASKVYSYHVQARNYVIETQAAAILSNGPGYRFLERMDGVEFNDLLEQTPQEKEIKKLIAASVMTIELINIFSGGCFDSDRHGNQLRVVVDHQTRKIILGLYDFGEMSLEHPELVELQSLSEAILTIQSNMSIAMPFERAVDEAVVDKMKECIQKGLPLNYLMRVRKALLALQDFQRHLSGDELLVVLRRVSLHQKTHPVIAQALKQCVQLPGYLEAAFFIAKSVYSCFSIWDTSSRADLSSRANLGSEPAAKKIKILGK